MVNTPDRNRETMKHSKEKVFDDFAQILGSGMGVLSGLSEQMQREIRARFEDLATHLDLVPREDFERLETMLTAARLKQEDMEMRLRKLEEKAGSKATKKTAKTKTKKQGKT